MLNYGSVFSFWKLLFMVKVWFPIHVTFTHNACGNLSGDLISPEGVTSLGYIYHIPLTWKEATAAQEEATQLQKLLREYNWQKKQIPIYINWVAYVKFCKSTLKSQMQYSTEL